MKHQNSLIGFLMVGVGIYFSLRQLEVTLLNNYYDWPTLLILLGIALLAHSHFAKDHSSVFIGWLLLGFGFHFLAVGHIPYWEDQWGVYVLIIGIAFLMKYTKVKAGLIPALLLIILGLFALFSPFQPFWFAWIENVFMLIQRFWTIILVGLGIYLLRK